MGGLERLPFGRQLTLVILATSAAALLLACGALAVYEAFDFRRVMARDMTVLGDILGETTHAALAFDDADAATGLLNALQAEPHVRGARIYDRDGAPFADYRRTGEEIDLPDRPGESGHRFTLDHLALFRPIARDGKPLGVIHLHVGLQGLYARLGFLALIAAVVLAGSVLLAWGISARLQRLVSGPILALAELARTVAERKDYSVRAPSTPTRSELGALTDAFNHMLAEIHRQEQARKGMEEMRTRLASIVESSEDAIVGKTTEGIVTSWNPGAEKLFGYTAAEAIGKPMMLVIPQERSAEEPDNLARIARGESRDHFETVRRRKNGDLIDVSMSISPIHDGDGKVVGASSIARDITGQKRDEGRIRAQLTRLGLLHRITRAIGERQDLESIFQVVIRSLEDDLSIDFGCVCLREGAGDEVVVSNVASRDESLALGLGLRKKDAIPVAANGLDRCLRGELAYEPDIAALGLPLSSRLAAAGLRSLVAAPLLVESKVFGVLLVARRQDHAFSSAECEFLRQLSEHVALAAHQTQLHIALQQAYDDLRQTQQAVMQQERLRVLGQMASGIAHDINNAISPVMLYTESLLERETALSERSRGYLETIKRAIEDVAHTVARMREFYRQREPQVTLTPVDLNEMVVQVEDLTRARWFDMPQQRGIVINLRRELAPALPAVQGIASEVREALINLVFNAVDAMPEGGTLTLRTRVAGDGITAERRVCVEVADTGIGMDDDTRKRCLEPFFTTKGERGTGLGLAMVYGVMQRHGAEVEIDSAPGAGSTMRMAFPLPVKAAADAQVVAAPVVPAGLRILVVDDDPLILKSMRDALEGDGHVIVTANHGQAGIDAFRAAKGEGQPFSVVITDLGMPHVDGRKVASTIKGESSRTPVIMLTGWGQRLLAEGDVPPHVDCVLSKPPKLSDLRGALARYCVPAGATT